MTTICYFGIFNPDYSRNRIFIKGLQKNGAKIIFCNSRLKGAAKYFDLVKKHFKIRNDYDAMIVGFPGYQSILLARILTRKPVIFDALSSFYDSMIVDRGLAAKKSLTSFYYWFLDWLSSRAADIVLLDTNAQIDFFVKNFKVKREKFKRIFIGSDDESVYPLDLKKEGENGVFLVHFHGYFNPLQGVEYILYAAKLLENENIKFNIIGKGQTYEEMKRLKEKLDLKNVNFIPPVPYDELKNYIARADICLGVFGNTEKASQVIPNKVFEALAMRLSVIAGDSLAGRELLTDKENVLFCRMADSSDLAQKILELKNNKEFRERLAINGFALFKEKLTPKVLGRELLDVINGAENKNVK